MPKIGPPDAFNTRHCIEDVVVPFNNRTKKPKPTLQRTHPDLCSEWLYKKNCGFGPEDFSYGSKVSAWWQCSVDNKHIWREQILKRAARGDGCPYCSHQRVTPQTCLAKTNPTLAKQWHPKNKLTAKQVQSASHLVVRWQCPKAPKHSWSTSIKARTIGKTGCPLCYQSRQVDLRKYPHVLKFFDHSKNKNIDPFKMTTTVKVWWICTKGQDHIWFRAFHKTVFKCPFCISRLVSVTNSLQTLYPEIAKEFHPTRNGKLTAATITATSHLKRWWKCRLNPSHSWQSTVNNRTRLGSGCPKCWAERRPAFFVQLRAKQKQERLSRRLDVPAHPKP